MKRALTTSFLLAALATIAILVALVQPGARQASGADTPLRIGVSLGLTGRYAPMAAMQEQGFRLWAEQQNQAGGLLGRQVKLLVRDDAGDPATARSRYEEFILKDRVDFLFAPYSSELTQAVASLAEKHGYPLVASGATSDALWDAGNPLLLGLFVPASRYAQGFLELLLQQGITRLALLTFPGMFPEELARGAQSWAGRLGQQALLVRRVNGPAPDLASAVAEARASGAEALLVFGYSSDAEAARRAVEAAGWRPRAFFATVGPSLESYGENLGGMAEGSFSSSHWEPGLPYPGAAGFTRDFGATYRRKPSYHAAGAFAAGQLLTQAVEKAGSTERRRVAEALLALDTTTILGRYAVNRQGVQARHFPVVVQWQSGRKVVVWPRELAAAVPRFARQASGVLPDHSTP
jgi:branched-chain amino acid transport system substrate-binding protein